MCSSAHNACVQYIRGEKESLILGKSCCMQSGLDLVNIVSAAQLLKNVEESLADQNGSATFQFL